MAYETELAALLEHIEAHLDQPLTLDALAQVAGYSKYHLSRLFKSAVGFPLHQYIARRRITNAAYALVTTDQPLLQIALAAGYETQPSFTRAFRKAYGLNPQAYRRRGSFTPVQPPFLVPRAKITQLFTPKGVAA